MRKDFENSWKKNETKVTADYAHLAVTLVNNWRATFFGFLKMHIDFLVFVFVLIFRNWSYGAHCVGDQYCHITTDHEQLHMLSHFLVHHHFNGCQIIMVLSHHCFINSLVHGPLEKLVSIPPFQPIPTPNSVLGSLLSSFSCSSEGKIQFWTHHSSTQTTSVAPQCLPIELYLLLLLAYKTLYRMLLQPRLAPKSPCHTPHSTSRTLHTLAVPRPLRNGPFHPSMSRSHPPFKASPTFIASLRALSAAPLYHLGSEITGRKQVSTVT